MTTIQDQSIEDYFLTLKRAYSATAKAEVEILTLEDFMGFIDKELTEETIQTLQKFLKELHVRDFMLFATTDINFSNHPKLEFKTEQGLKFFGGKTFSEMTHVFLTVAGSAKLKAEKQKKNKMN